MDLPQCRAVGAVMFLIGSEVNWIGLDFPLGGVYVHR
jgi:hypothetical protein